jgi:LmbE family N-acetylglucosaminyl deacetylase
MMHLLLFIFWRNIALRLNNIEEISRQYRHIFLSPHLDDVVYSCGGTLAVQVNTGMRPLVITVFAGIPSTGYQPSPFALQIQKEMGFRDNPTVVMEARRKEDATALDFLNCDYLWLDYLDAMYRGSPGYYANRQQLIGGEVNGADLVIERQLAQDLLALEERLPDVVWYAPLGVGRHVDHQIVASAADRLVQRNANINFYEDFPYVLQQGALEARLQEMGGALEPAYVEMSEMLPLREQASVMYSSQIESNFGSVENMRRNIYNYTHGIRPVQTVCLERYWEL